MSLRKTSCASCAAAKRRCDRGLPACLRCRKQLLPCKYPYPPDLHESISPPVQDIGGVYCAGFGEDVLSGPPPPTDTAMLDDFPDVTLLDVDFDSLANFGSFGSQSDVAWEPQSLQFETQMVADPVPDVIHSLAMDSQMDTSGAQLSLADSEAMAFSLIQDMAVNDLDNPFSGQQGSPLQKYVRKHRLRQRQLSRQSRQEEASSPLNPLCAGQPWLHGRDVATWTFCANELLSFIKCFATTASAPFIKPTHGFGAGRVSNSGLAPGSDPEFLSGRASTGLQPALQKALGICTAHVALSDASRPVFVQLLESEVESLIEDSPSHLASSTLPLFAGYGAPYHDTLVSAFREELARLQALILYEIIRLYGPGGDPLNQARTKRHSALLASWTRELLLRLQTLQLNPSTARCFTSPSAPSDSTESRRGYSPPSIDTDSGFSSTAERPSQDGTLPLQREEIESAYRTILVSYLTRTVHIALVQQECPLLNEMIALPMALPVQLAAAETQSSGGNDSLASRTMTYLELTSQKHLKTFASVDRFFILPLVACKGVSTLKP